MATTTNFGWETPDDTDLVKDGAAAIRTALGGVDTSFVDLKGGTTGQVLAKASGTDLDFSWVAVDPLTILDAKGDLITATAADTPARLAVGTNGQTLVADSSTSTGLKWATPATSSSGMTLITRSTFTNVAGQTFDGVFTSSYKQYMVVIENIGAATGADDLLLRMTYAGPTIQTTGYYGSTNWSTYNSAIGTNYTSNGAAMLLGVSTGLTTETSTATIYFSQVGNSSQMPSFYGQITSQFNESTGTFGGRPGTARTYTGFNLSSSSSNVTGTVAVYGLATA